MKKFISTLLALVMVFSLATVAFAATNNNKEVSLPKTYKVNNGTAPAETFEFNFTPVSYKNGENVVSTNSDDIPAIENVTIEFAESDEDQDNSVKLDLDLDNYALGVYTYEVAEVVTNKTAGTSYSDENLYLVLTILRDESSNKYYVAYLHYESADGTDKSTGFTNEYDAGKLTVTKQIEGNMADMDKEFTFTIILNAPSGTAFDSTVQNAIDNTGATPVYNADNTSVTITVDLGDGDSINITNIPAGTTYTVSEDAGKYTSDNGVYSDEADTKTISANDEDTVTFTNTLTADVDTGITLDSMPFVIMLAVCALAAVLFVTKRRHVED